MTKDRNLPWLQLRILHRILPVKRYLNILKIKGTDKCDFCKNDAETIEHLFVDCVKTSLFLFIYFYYKTTKHIIGITVTWL